MLEPVDRRSSPQMGDGGAIQGGGFHRGDVGAAFLLGVKAGSPVDPEERRRVHAGSASVLVESPAVVGAGEGGATGVEVRQAGLGGDGCRRCRRGAGSSFGLLTEPGSTRVAGVETHQVVGAGLEALEAVHVVADDHLVVVGVTAGQQVVPGDLGGGLARQ